MNHLLIIAPHFAPTNAPDGHRVRQLIPEWVKFGWHCTVLTTIPSDSTAPIEMELLDTLPAEGCDIVRVSAVSRKWGLGNLGLRSKWAMARKGDELLAQHKFNLVYFSTTQFPVLPLGPRWLRKFKVPYVIDLQDPWLNDFYYQPGAPKPPGGWKYRFSHWQAKREEPETLRAAGHIVSVSPAYITMLTKRYAWFDPNRATVIPFGWSQDDQRAAQNFATQRTSTQLDPTIYYIGRVTESMIRGLDELFECFANWRKRADLSLSNIQWQFLGTSYSGETGGGVVTQCAQRHGLEDCVSERTERIPYLESLKIMQNASANLILGSSDRGYTPSKLWPLLATGQPWLATAEPHSNLAERLSFDSENGFCHVHSEGQADSRKLTSFFKMIATQQHRVSRPDNLLATLSSAELARIHLTIFTDVTESISLPTTPCHAN